MKKVFPELSVRTFIGQFAFNYRHVPAKVEGANATQCNVIAEEFFLVKVFDFNIIRVYNERSSEVRNRARRFAALPSAERRQNRSSPDTVYEFFGISYVKNRVKPLQYDPYIFVIIGVTLFLFLGSYFSFGSLCSVFYKVFPALLAPLNTLSLSNIVLCLLGYQSMVHFGCHVLSLFTLKNKRGGASRYIKPLLSPSRMLPLLLLLISLYNNFYVDVCVWVAASISTVMDVWLNNECFLHFLWITPFVSFTFGWSHGFRVSEDGLLQIKQGSHCFSWPLGRGEIPSHVDAKRQEFYDAVSLPVINR